MTYYQPGVLPTSQGSSGRDPEDVDFLSNVNSLQSLSVVTLFLNGLASLAAITFLLTLTFLKPSGSGVPIILLLFSFYFSVRIISLSQNTRKAWSRLSAYRIASLDNRDKELLDRVGEELLKPKEEGYFTFHMLVNAGFLLAIVWNVLDIFVKALAL